ncbi:uncharacterized protein [Scyliorhinus torazame]|uniref:uncharacterized protein n=1 Tax=Scyliorhinus torazame TaxID=75743 RepID=UPI003B5AD2E7
MADAGLHGGTALLTVEKMTEVMAVELEKQFARHMEALRKEMAVALKSLVEEAITPVRVAVAKTSAEVREQGEKMKEVEEAVSQHSDQFTSMGDEQRRVVEVTEDSEQSLENRLRRHNLGIVSLPEGTESPRPTENFAKKLAELMGVGENPSRYERDRAHRSLRPKPKVNEPPRAVIICFHKYCMKEKVLSWAKKKREVQWDGAGVRICQDLTVELAKKQAAFRITQDYLHDKAEEQAIQPNQSMLLFEPPHIFSHLNELPQTLCSPLLHMLV